MKKTCAVLSALILLASLCFVRPAFALQRYLRVGFNTYLPPFQFVDASGTPAGMHIDMLNAIGENRGYSFEFRPYENNRELYKALENGEIDLIVGAIEGSEHNGEELAYTEPLTSSQLCMIVENETMKNDERIKTAIFASDTISHLLLANLGVHQFIAVGNQTMVYQRHLEYPGSAMIGVKDSLLYQLVESGVDEDYTVRYNYLNTLFFSLVTRSEDVELQTVLNDSISQFKAGQQYENICNKWLPDTDHNSRFRQIFERVMIAAAAVLLLALAYSLLMRRIQRMLKRRVAEQTAQLKSANDELERQFAQLRDENDLRNRIIKYSPSGMLLFNTDYAIVLMNKSACAIAGVETSRIGESALSIPVFGDILKKEGESVFVEGMTVENGSIRLGDSPIRMRSFNYTMHQVIRYGNVAGILLAVQDMTKIERMQQMEFEKAKSSALTRIAAGVAHEIRNPLMAIRTFATLIGSKGDDKQVQESFARYVPDEVDRINRLIENLIHYSKPTKCRPERVSVVELIVDSLSLVQPMLRKGGFQVRREISQELYITVDRDQMKQILINILINSTDAMERKIADGYEGEPLCITVRAEEQKGKIALTLMDQGVGMSEEELQICKDPFFSTKESGSGLGLALCEQYVKENNGALEIDSVKNEYTRITLLFEGS